MGIVLSPSGRELGNMDQGTARNDKVLPKHLRRLEADSVEIMPEVIAGFRDPAMLCSLGQDSSALLHPAVKTFHAPYLMPVRLLPVRRAMPTP